MKARLSVIAHNGVPLCTVALGDLSKAPHIMYQPMTGISVSFPTRSVVDLYRMQIEGEALVKHGVTFCEHDPTAETDWIVCYGDFVRAFETHVPRKRRILIITEPKEIRYPSSAFLDQFGVVIGPGNFPSYRGTRIISHGGLTWFYPIKDIGPDAASLFLDFSALATMKRPVKEASISVVISRKTITRMHRQRLDFVERLRQEIGDRLKIFGSGFRPIAAKADAINPYAYHLALENNDVDSFWTEKIADAYLGYAFPIYAGCKDIGDYFPPNSYLPIDYSRADDAVARIKELLESPSDPDRLDAVAEARWRLLNEHSLVALVARAVNALHADAKGPFHSTPQRLHPDKTMRTVKEGFRKWLITLNR